MTERLRILTLVLILALQPQGCSVFAPSRSITVDATLSLPTEVNFTGVPQTFTVSSESTARVISDTQGVQYELNFVSSTGGSTEGLLLEYDEIESRSFISISDPLQRYSSATIAGTPNEILEAYGEEVVYSNSSTTAQIAATRVEPKIAGIVIIIVVALTAAVLGVAFHAAIEPVREAVITQAIGAYEGQTLLHMTVGEFCREIHARRTLERPASFTMPFKIMKSGVDAVGSAIIELLANAVVEIGQEAIDSLDSDDRIARLAEEQTLTFVSFLRTEWRDPDFTADTPIFIGLAIDQDELDGRTELRSDFIYSMPHFYRTDPTIEVAGVPNDLVMHTAGTALGGIIEIERSLEWTPTDKATGYRVRAKSPDSSLFDEIVAIGQDELAAWTSGETIRYILSDLGRMSGLADVEYFVVAENHYGVTPPSNSVVDRTQDGSSTLEQPTGVTIIAESSTEISLSWQDIEGEDGYIIERMKIGFDYLQVAEVGSDEVVYTDSIGLEENYSYYYRVAAYLQNDDGSRSFSEYSDGILVTTAENEARYSVVYLANESDSGLPPNDETQYLDESSVVLLGNTGVLTLDGHEFAGWRIESNGSIHYPGDTIVLSGSDVYLIAFFEDTSDSSAAWPTTGLGAIDSNFLFSEVIASGSNATFVMGTSTGEDNESPPHSVNVSTPYSINKFEITNKQIALVYNESLRRNFALLANYSIVSAFGSGEELLDFSDPDKTSLYVDGDRIAIKTGREDYPATEITWFGAMFFCYCLNVFEVREQSVDINNWSIDISHEGYRLPTEAEWEYAAHGGKNAEFTLYSGSDIATDVAWFHSHSGSDPKSVGTKMANEIGLFDMSGNVEEWVFDYYSSIYYSVSEENDPVGPASGSGRVRKSGTSSSSEADVRITYRSGGGPDREGGRIGFRIVKIGF